MTKKAALLRIFGIGILLGAVVMVLFLLRTAPLKLDANAVPAPTKGPTQQELQAELQRQAEETGFRFRMSTAPQFETGDGPGGLNIANSVENSQNMYVVVTLDATGEELYRSAELPPGGQVLEDKLLLPLTPGDHPATAVCHVLDDKGGEAGTIETAITITVQS